MWTETDLRNAGWQSHPQRPSSEIVQSPSRAGTPTQFLHRGRSRSRVRLYAVVGSNNDTLKTRNPRGVSASQTPSGSGVRSKLYPHEAKPPTMHSLNCIHMIATHRAGSAQNPASPDSGQGDTLPFPVIDALRADTTVCWGAQALPDLETSKSRPRRWPCQSDRGNSSLPQSFLVCSSGSISRALTDRPFFSFTPSRLPTPPPVQQAPAKRQSRSRRDSSRPTRFATLPPPWSA